APARSAHARNLRRPRGPSRPTDRRPPFDRRLPAPLRRRAGPAGAAADVPRMSELYKLHVNGVEHEVADAWLGESLLFVLRERLGLPGAKDGGEGGGWGAGLWDA